MSTCFKGSYDYELVKKFCKCGNILLKSNFRKSKTKIDGLDPKCTFCRKKNYLENRNRIKNYYLDNRERINEYQMKNHNNIIARTKAYLNNRYRTTINFRLFRKTRSRIRQSLNRKTKSLATRENLGIDIKSYRKWIEWLMTPEMNLNNTEIDHIEPLCMFDISKED